MNNKTQLARNLRKNSTKQELILWTLLRNHGINNLKFKRQYPIGNYIVDFICKETFFYLFLVDEKILGVIYFFQDDGKLYLNGFAVRKFLKEKLEALKLATTWFNCEIYAEAQNKASAYCLKKVGFKKITERLYAYYPQFFPT